MRYAILLRHDFAAAQVILFADCHDIIFRMSRR